jgi:hypothetical protein
LFRSNAGLHDLYHDGGKIGATAAVNNQSLIMVDAR